MQRLFSWPLVAVVLVLLVSMSAGSGEGDEFAAAKIFLRKHTATPFPLIIAKDFTVTYSAYNGGETDASLLTITDSYHPDSFTFKEGVGVDGTVTKTFAQLGAGETVSFNVTVVPKLKGVYESTRAKIKYNPSAVVMEDVAPDMRFGHSSSLGQVRIVTESDFQRLHLSSWVTPATGSLAALAVVAVVAAVVLAVRGSRPRATSSSSSSSSSSTEKKTKKQ